MAEMFNTSPANDEELASHNDPGAYIVGFGMHSSQRLDSIPDHWLWATGTECQSRYWYAAFKEANHRYEELLFQTPEAYPLPFGMYENKRIDKVPENYIWWAIDPSSLQKPWYRKMVETTFRYRNHKCPTTLPASVMASTAGPSIGDHSYPQLQDLVRRGEALPAIPPRPYRKRRPPNVQNPVGELVDERDDVRVSVGPDDKYEMDDFVVPDDEEGCRKEISQEEDEEVHDGGSDAHGGVDVSGSQTERLSPSRASADDFQTLESELDSDSGDYESDTPLGQLHVKKMAKRRAGKRKAEDVSSSCPQRTHQSTGESSDNDIAAQLPRKRLKGPRLIHRRARNDSHSGAEPVASTSRLDDEQESPHHHHHSHFGSSQESAASSSIADEPSLTPKESSQINEGESSVYGIYPNLPSALGRYYRARPRVPDSDDEESLSGAR